MFGKMFDIKLIS